MDKNIRLAVIKAETNKDTGQPIVPNKADYDKNTVNAIASADNNVSVAPKGMPGKKYQAGAFYLGNFDVDANQWVSELVPAPAIQLPGSMKPTDVKANADGSFSEGNV